MSAGDVTREQRVELHSHRLRAADSHQKLEEARNGVSSKDSRRNGPADTLILSPEDSLWTSGL